MAFTINREEVKPKSHSQDFIPSFIRKTYDILEEARFPQYIDWNPEGTALVIKKPSEFSQKVLPIYFKHNNFTSFVRQLNMYDFHKRRTQGLDHVYVHELFQKGKRHLLQEIKRKTHETASEKTPKANEIMETSKPSSEDLSCLIKENQLFKHLYNEAMNRLASLERRAKELAAQNQSLASQIHKQGEMTGASIFKPIISRIESQGELTLDQLPMTMGKMSLNLTSSYQAPAQVSRLFSQSNAAAYMKPPVDLQREESSSVSTEVSRNSPLVVPSGLECEETVDNRKKAEVYNPFTSITRGCPSLRITSELSITRQEMSTGQMIDSWNFEFGGDDVLCFADQKAEKPAVSTQPVTYQDKSLLGKRMLDQNVDMSFYIPEPAMKRPELCIFTKKSIISSGVEDQEGTDGNFYGTNTVGIDLIEF